MRRRDLLLAMTAAGAYGAIGPAAAAAPELIDEHWLASGDRDAGGIDHDPWDAWLKRYIVLGDDGIARLRYGEVSAADRDLLAGYIETLAGLQMTSYPRGDQLAAWINLYNALTVDLILRNYPVVSIRDITEGLFSFGPWGIELVEVEGRGLSLDEIEHGILRPIWRDPRIHYGLNCASIGCPNLSGRAYRGADIESMLDGAARDYVNHPRGAAFDRQDRLTVSSIYVWFQEDFGGSESGVIEHLRVYADAPLRGRLEGVAGFDDDRYDWSINDAAVR